MPRLTLAGHPVHPQVIVFPAALLPFSFAMDSLYVITGDRAYAKAAHSALLGGGAMAVAAGIAGALDYLAIRNRTQEKRLGNVHALLNLGALVLTGINLRLRRNTQPRSKSLALLLGAATTTSLLISQWYGGELVYGLGVRVKAARELENAAELKVPGDERAEQAFREGAKGVTSAGPQERIA
jgi:uncharacterized membrane protein